jgi:tRNA (guanine-N7-)-methyltransferase
LLPSFGRRRGRRLRPTKQELMDTLLQELSITLPQQTCLEPATLFPEAKEYWLEIGFGGGEHLAHQAERYPHAAIIGCEPYIHGIAWLLSHVKERALHNVRVFTDDARLLLDALPDHSLDKVFILYPDPWPKKRHHRRRLVSNQTLDALARVLKPGAELRLATDDADYCTWMLEHLQAHAAFESQAKQDDDRLIPWEDWVSTRYEQKALEAGRRPNYLTYKIK